MNTGQLVCAFLESRQAKGDSIQTIKWYGYILTRFNLEYPALPRQPFEIDAFLNKCPGGDERRHGWFRTLRAFYRFLYRRREIRHNPMDAVESPRRRKKVPRIISIEDLQRLLSYPHSRRTHALLRVLADTGARIGEVARLNPDDLQESEGCYTVQLRGKTGERRIPISPQTYEMLTAELPFGLSTEQLGRHVARAFEAAGIDGTAHTLRHTFGTLWEGSEFALQRILGHSNFDMLARYRQMRTGYLARQHREFSPLHQIDQLRMDGL